MDAASTVVLVYALILTWSFSGSGSGVLAHLAIAVGFLLTLRWTQAASGGSGQAGTGQQHPRSEGPVSRQLCAQSLQQSLCSPRTTPTRGGGPGGVLFSPVKKVFKSIFTGQPISPSPVGGARHKGFARISSDGVLPPLTPSPSDADGSSGRAAFQQRASLGAAPVPLSASASPRWQPDIARITSGQDLQAMDDTSSTTDGAPASPQPSGSRMKGQQGQKQAKCASDATCPSITGTGVVDCLQSEATDPLMRPDIAGAVPEVHLLQLGALMGEAGAQAALREQQQQGMNTCAGPGPNTFLGVTDDAAHYAQGWEPIVEEHRPGLHYWAWRRYLRKGLYMFKCRTVFEGGVDVALLSAFNFDWRYKQVSDDGCADLRPMLPPGCCNTSTRSDSSSSGAALFLDAAATCPDPAAALDSNTSTGAGTSTSTGAGTSTNTGAGTSVGSERGAGAGGEEELAHARVDRSLSSSSASSSGQGGGGGASAVRSLEEELEARTFCQSAYQYARTKFPPPMASRQYVYARRVWLKPDDGGCYVVSRGAFDQLRPPFTGRAFNVEDMISGFVIRSAHGIYDRTSPAAEMVTMYFENSNVAPGIVNIGVRKALWPIVQKMNDALRQYKSCSGSCTTQTNHPSKLVKAAAAAGVRADQSLLRYQRVLQRYRSAAGGPSARVSAAGSVLSLAPAGEGVSNISSRNALAGVGGSSGSLEVASSGGVRESREGAAAQAAANEEEALILRAFDAGTMLPRQSRRWRMSPVVYRAYLGACTVLGSAKRSILFSAWMVLRLQLACNRACLAGLRSMVLSNRYARLCAWLQQLSINGGGAAVSATALPPTSSPKAHALPPLETTVSPDSSPLLHARGTAQGCCSPSSRAGSVGSNSWWEWSSWWGGRVEGSRPELSSHALRASSLKPFRSHPLRGSLRDSTEVWEGGLAVMQEGADEGAARFETMHEGHEGESEGVENASSRSRSEAGQGTASGGKQRKPFGRRLVGKAATFALRAAALPLMHRALRAYTSNEGHGGGLRQQWRQQQRDETGSMEEEDEEAAVQRAERRARWLSEVAESQAIRRPRRANSYKGGMRENRSFNGVPQSPLKGGGAVPASPARVPHQGMHSVHSFPTLMAAQSPSKGGLGGARGGFVEDGGQDHSYRRSLSQGNRATPALVVDGVSFSGFSGGDSPRQASQPGLSTPQHSAGPLGSSQASEGRRRALKWSNSEQPSPSPAKQKKLTLSEMGMMRGDAW